jgi:uncharacterized membrane protein
LPGTQIPNTGEIQFRPQPNGMGTEVNLHMRFEPPLGAVGKALMRAFHPFPRAVAGKTLRRFKSLIETGEIPTLEHNPSGRGDSDII